MHDYPRAYRLHQIFFLRATLDQLQQQPAGAVGDGVGNAEETPSPSGLLIADVLLC